VAGIRIKIDDADVRSALDRLAEGKLLQAALKVIGQELIKSTRRRFDAQVDPSGQRWKPLNAYYAAGKTGRLILQGAGLAGGLLGSITAQVDGSTLRIGTNKVYGAIHQFGGTIVPRTFPALVFKINGKLSFARQVTIPARPFLGISEADRQEIPKLIEDVVNAFASGR
jgi:phage virion morphogenesis protein